MFCFTWSEYSFLAIYWNSKNPELSWKHLVETPGSTYFFVIISRGSVPSKNCIASLSLGEILFAYEMVCVIQKLWIVTYFALYKEKSRVPEGKSEGYSGAFILFCFSRTTPGLKNRIKSSECLQVWKFWESIVSLGVHILTLHTNPSLLFSKILVLRIISLLSYVSSSIGLLVPRPLFL